MFSPWQENRGGANLAVKLRDRSYWFTDAWISPGRFVKYCAVRSTVQYRVVPWSTAECCAVPWSTVEDRVGFWSTVECHVMPWSTVEYFGVL